MKYNIKYLFLLIILLLTVRNSYATHARAGEILFRQLSLYTYEIEVIYYTESSSIANRENIDIYCGDNTVSNVLLTTRKQLKNSTFFSSYKTVHTYPGPGTYVIEFYDPNRIESIKNMDNSVNTPFYVETQLIINPFIGNNRSPILLQPPIDYAEIYQIFAGVRVAVCGFDGCERELYAARSHNGCRSADSCASRTCLHFGKIVSRKWSTANGAC